MLRAAIVRGTAVSAALMASAAWATPQPITGAYVVHIETTYYPSFLEFTLSAGNTPCPGGFTYQSTSLENMKAAYAALLASDLSQHTIYIYYDTTVASPLGSTACSVVNLGLN
jgi:hypothetical protein